MATEETGLGDEGSHPGEGGNLDQDGSGEGQPQWRSGLVPPAAQDVILETWDRVPHQAPCMVPASPSACVSASLSLAVSL